MTDQGHEHPGNMPPPDPQPPSESQPPREPPPPAEAQPPPPPAPQPPPPAAPQPPPFPASAPSGGIGTPADLGTRFLARLIDTILLGILTSIIVIPLVIASAFTDVNTGFSGAFFGGLGVGSIIASIVVAAIYIGYFALMESSVGQTVGKMALGIRTLGPGGDKPTFAEGVKRNSWYALGIIPFIGGLAELGVAIYIAITINNSATRTGWHDTFAGGTSVVKAR